MAPKRLSKPSRSFFPGPNPRAAREGAEKSAESSPGERVSSREGQTGRSSLRPAVSASSKAQLMNTAGTPHPGLRLSGPDSLSQTPARGPCPGVSRTPRVPTAALGEGSAPGAAQSTSASLQLGTQPGMVFSSILLCQRSGVSSNKPESRQRNIFDPVHDGFYCQSAL